MWTTFLNVSVNKAMIMTTHSMEEASVLANRVGILAGKMLSTGTTDSLVAQHATYEIHFSCRTPEDIDNARRIMATVPDSRPTDDVATRYEVPVTSNRSLSSLFKALNRCGDWGEYTVERASLESIFLKAIREHNVAEERVLPQVSDRWWQRWGKRTPSNEHTRETRS